MGRIRSYHICCRNFTQNLLELIYRNQLPEMCLRGDFDFVSIYCGQNTVDVLTFFSATDALKGEGLQEGVDWLQGTRADMHESHSESVVVSLAHGAVWLTFAWTLTCQFCLLIAFKSGYRLPLLTYIQV